MRHQDFAEQAARKLEDIAEAIKKDELPVSGGIAAMRANELRVAARMVCGLSRVATQKEEEKSLPLEVPSKKDLLAHQEPYLHLWGQERGAGDFSRRGGSGPKPQNGAMPYLHTNQCRLAICKRIVRDLLQSLGRGW